MARIANSFVAAAIANPTNALETVIATLGPISPVYDTAPILLYYFFVLAMGTAGVSVLPKIRQGTTNTGSLVQNTSLATPLAAGVNGTLSGFYIDTAAGADQFYALTVTCASATATSTIGTLFFGAMCL